MSTSDNRRALHFALKIGNYNIRVNYNFFVKLLGMKVLRHEEFNEGYKAFCNGPYDGRWSKTIIGYGKQDSHFVVELMYNYGVRQYVHGNDLKGITIQSSDVFNTFRRVNYIQRQVNDDTLEVPSPDRYPFFIVNRNKSGADPIFKLSLLSFDLERTIAYWSGKLGMNILERNNDRVLLSYGSEQCHLEFVCSKGKPIEHGSAFGRIVFSCPQVRLPVIETTMRSSGQTILKFLTSLDTTGKTTVDVVILADPDGHELCFVGDEAFRKLSDIDPNADRLLAEAMDADTTD